MSRALPDLLVSARALKLSRAPAPSRFALGHAAQPRSHEGTPRRVAAEHPGRVGFSPCCDHRDGRRRSSGGGPSGRNLLGRRRSRVGLRQDRSARSSAVRRGKPLSRPGGYACGKTLAVSSWGPREAQADQRRERDVGEGLWLEEGLATREMRAAASTNLGPKTRGAAHPQGDDQARTADTGGPRATPFFARRQWRRNG